MSAVAKDHLREVRETTGNKLLAALPVGEYKRFLLDLEPVHLNSNQVIYESGEPIDHVYFPANSLVSMLALLEDGTTVEIGMIGSYGMVGIPAILGANRATNWTLVQVAGEAMRMKASVLKDWFNESEPFSRLLSQYYRDLITQISQRAVCNVRHMVMQRLCTWLLMAHDLLESDHLPLTQDLISRRLGSRRASVTKVVNDLQNMGIINHGRGYTTIINRRGLKSLACECYSIISAEYERSLQLNLFEFPEADS